jgi:hypothetical protein
VARAFDSTDRAVRYEYDDGGRAEKERVFALRDEARRRQLVNQGAIHLLVKVELEVL